MAGKPFHSKLVPHFEQIRHWRRQRVGWRQIAAALTAAGTPVAASSVCEFFARHQRRPYALGMEPAEPADATVATVTRTTKEVRCDTAAVAAAAQSLSVQPPVLPASSGRRPSLVDALRARARDAATAADDSSRPGADKGSGHADGQSSAAPDPRPVPQPLKRYLPVG